jgi:predicted RNA-binding Zn-ribbon protein involved in translation (DUF1610 family)
MPCRPPADKAAVRDARLAAAKLLGDPHFRCPACGADLWRANRKLAVGTVSIRCEECAWEPFTTPPARRGQLVDPRSGAGIDVEDTFCERLVRLILVD